MKPLAEQKCVSCRTDCRALTAGELRAARRALPGWTVEKVKGVPRLVRAFSFPDFARAIRFADKLAALADREDHHPALLVEWGRVTASWWTHSIKGLHHNDLVMAAKTSKLYRT